MVYNFRFITKILMLIFVSFTWYYLIHIVKPTRVTPCKLVDKQIVFHYIFPKRIFYLVNKFWKCMTDYQVTRKFICNLLQEIRICGHILDIVCHCAFARVTIQRPANQETIPPCCTCTYTLHTRVKVNFWAGYIYRVHWNTT